MSVYKSVEESIYSGNISYNKNSLMHSDTYLGQDYTNGLYHWKYIKREKVNGKWRYYYKNEELEKSEAAVRKAETDANVKGLRYHVERQNTTGNGDISGALKNKRGNVYGTTLNKNYTYSGSKVEEDYIKATQKANKVYKENAKIRLKSIPVAIVATGVAAAKNVLSSIGSLFKKKKKK